MQLNKKIHGIDPAVLNRFTNDELEYGLKESIKKFERETILKALESAGHDKSRAASLLGMSLSSLYRKISELGIAG